jgi:uncharacterized membrane protein YccC
VARSPSALSGARVEPRRRLAGLANKIVQHEATRPAYAAGLRAAVVTTAPVIAAVALDRPSLAWMAIGAWLVTLCDVGGAYATRAFAMLSMTVGGVLVLLFAGVVSPHFGLSVAVLLVLGTGLSLLRALGDVGAKVGSPLVVILALTLGSPSHGLHQVALDALLFGAGGLVSTALALLFWGVHPYKPARLAIAQSLVTLADAVGELGDLCQSGAEKTLWDAWIRSSPRRVRAAIEAAQAALLATRRGRIAGSTTGDRLQVIVEQTDGIFEAMIALGDQLEHSAARAMGEGADVARSLAAITSALRRLAEATLDPSRLTEAKALALDPARAAIEAEAPSRRSIQRSVLTIEQALALIATVLSLLPGVTTAAPRQDVERVGPVTAVRRALATLRANLTPGSHAFRHAARVGITTAAAMLLMKLVPLPHGPWAVLAAAVSLQPSHAATWSRTVQRVVGTAVGALLVALLVVVAPHPFVMTAIIAATIFAAVALLPLSYFYFAFFITPAFVLFAELVERRQDLASIRALDTLIGGALAVVGASLFWRRADDQALLRELAVAVERARVFFDAALARLAGTSAPSDAGDAALAEARRQVGLANNNAEATLQQLLGAGAAPRHEALAVVLTYLRRIAATTINVLAAGDVPRGPALAAYTQRIDASLTAARASLEEAAHKLPRARAKASDEEAIEGELAAVSAEGLPEPLRRIEIFVCEMRRRLSRLA